MGWFDDVKEVYGIPDKIESKVSEILSELERYSRGEIDLTFIDRKVNISITEENAIMKMKNACGKMNVATSRLVAKGFSEIYKRAIKLVRVEALRMLYEDIVGSTQEYSYIVDVQIQFDEEPTRAKHIYVHEELFYIVNWVARAFGVDVSAFIRLCLRMGCVVEKVVSEQIAERYVATVDRFVNRVELQYATYYGLLAFSVVRSKGKLDNRLIEDAEKALKIKRGSNTKRVDLRGIDEVLYEMAKRLAKMRGCRVGDVVNEGLLLVLAAAPELETILKETILKPGNS